MKNQIRIGGKPVIRQAIVEQLPQRTDPLFPYIEELLVPRRVKCRIIDMIDNFRLLPRINALHELRPSPHSDKCNGKPATVAAQVSDMQNSSPFFSTHRASTPELTVPMKAAKPKSIENNSIDSTL